MAEQASSSFGKVTTNKFNFLHIKWRRFLVFYFLSPFQLYKALSNQDKIIHFVDYKYFSLWICLFCNIFWRKKVYLHGHGGYKRQGVLSSLIHTIYLLFASGYICYCEYSAHHLKSITSKLLHKKISIVPNSLYLEPETKITSAAKTKNIFYIGRVRERCGLEILLKSAEQLGLVVEVLGTGDTNYKEKLKASFPTANFHGAVYEDKKQRQIARKCFCGVYAGDAGLSVVHYMAFGLPVIIHGNMRMHMGPEPSYVIHKGNGLIFKRQNVDSLVHTLDELIKNEHLRTTLATGALKTFNALRDPPMHESFLKILGEKI